MKSSYLLYGLFWDGRPTPKTVPEILRSDNMTEMTVLSLKERFEDNTPSQIQDYTSEIAIMVDYFPLNDKRSVVDFYLIRLLQIVEFYNAKICCDDKTKMEFLVQWVSDYYKKKNTA